MMSTKNSLLISPLINELMDIVLYRINTLIIESFRSCGGASARGTAELRLVVFNVHWGSRNSEQFLTKPPPCMLETYAR